MEIFKEEVQMINTLYLTLTRKYWDKVASGRKRFEFRVAKPYWQARLEEKTFDMVVFTNGYEICSPKVFTSFGGIQLRRYKGNYYYVIYLPEVLDKNPGMKIVYE